MFIHPRSHLSHLGIQSGQQIADFGTGSGFYAFAAAEMLHGQGKVFAIDIQKDLLDRLKNEAVRRGLDTVSVVWGDVEQLGGTHLRDTSIDRVIISDVLSQAEDQGKVAAEAARIVKSNGKLLVVDWSDSSDLSGPDRSHLISAENAQVLFEAVGFAFEKKLPAGGHHYSFIMHKN
ncbi:MAG: hypothetical protein A2664_04220 [Candidatus Taylorbacteria bacterium RIFCSPHIGHO2_01_FULL_46_22b]|uniref:Methyltransferase domain-containing protein n=1 Tax=Candidatus Taylorbacteria bacterium RIFCSPHIGHO2_01_FULL_46_22b TaxID=1802301 RepID=A0A1G2M3Z4_9BACT|nr:MAG: hypothetical protein A2664_04220 [Candidatus Taylorbacteria bacterium RIFCSPHIGHO2_01_FULL_46_22b]